jgi:hypothetical protein
MYFTIEELTMNALPSLQTILLDGWVIRMANGYTKRANSVNPIYSYENNLDEKIKYCENIFRNNNLPVIFKIIECDEYKILDKKLEEINYDKIDLTSVQICDDLKNINISKNVVVNNSFNDNWKDCFFNCSNINEKNTKETIDNMLKNIRHKIICAYIKESDTFIGCGFGVIENGFIGLFDILVKEEYRGKGFGNDIVKTILAKGKDTGANKAHLSVVYNNTIAKNLYEKIGFKEIYKYWYRKKE